MAGLTELNAHVRIGLEVSMHGIVTHLSLIQSRLRLVYAEVILFNITCVTSLLLDLKVTSRPVHMIKISP